jgi:hypothetical protein
MKFVLIYDDFENINHNIINSINSNEIYIIYNQNLQRLNFEETITNLYKNKNFYFSSVDYITRSLLETAYVGIKNYMLNNNDEIVFLHKINPNLNLNNLEFKESFFGYSNLLNFCGIYGFKNIEIFNKYAKKVLLENIIFDDIESFLKVYGFMKDNNEKIIPLFIEEYSLLLSEETNLDLPLYKKSDFINNKVKNNKYNTLTKKNDEIIKEGKFSIVKGELNFYRNIPDNLSHFFPKLTDFTIDEENQICQLKMDYINGIPLFFLHKNELISNKIIDELFNLLDKIHNYKYDITITETSIHNNYFKKLEDRFNKTDYFFEDADEIFQIIKEDLKKNYSPEIVGVIHGDFWFPNILLEYSGKFKLIDMKGQVDGILTLNGDKYYDYGKLYQCILGFDLYMNGCKINYEYMNNLEKYFLKKCRENQINIDYLKAVTNSLTFGTFHAIEDDETKIRIWNFLKKTIVINN